MREHDACDGAATRWLGRFTLETRDVTIADVKAAPD
jgi:hypothetical protein